MRMRLLDNIINYATNQVEGFCIVKTAQVKSNVKGADYLDLYVFDASGEINAKLWDYDAEKNGIYASQDIIKIRGTIVLFKEVEQLRIDRIRKATEHDAIDMRLLVPCAPESSADMYKRVLSYTELITDPSLLRVTQHALSLYENKLQYYPAALRLHHAYRGGLLYHMVTMLDAAKALCTVYEQLYPSLRAELVYAGIILHDIEKIEELSVSELGMATAYTPSGELIGHINMGVNLIGLIGKELNIDDDTIMLLQHIVLSHHGDPEYGSPKLPMFPEAEIVSKIDTLDAKLFTMYSELDAIEEGQLTDRIWSLDNRKLYKHWK
ncbi:MAG: HD domain-containing protein [Clostridia bacterium]|nr:HD domain-containing protein [Clostridia bacterium]